ncbi:MAG TPA: sugar ABC transporter permease [Mycobacteriales bacterium]|nr:sugar ABC transporter permease [Mycobacteriales bacterium]
MSIASVTGEKAAAPPSAPPAKSRRQGRATLWVWLFLAPTIVLYGVFTVYPIIGSYWYSFLDWDGFTAQKTFVGLQNYRQVIDDPLFWGAFRHTLLFMVVTVPVQVFLSLLLAILLNSPKMPFSRIFRTALFLPVVTTTAIVGVVMQSIFDPANGPVNLFIQKLGFSGGINFLGSSSTSLWTGMAVYVWKWLGITLIYWLAALQTVPKELYEAASIDGATARGLFRYITLPLLKPFTIIITLLSLEASLHVFDLVQTMTGGGPFYSSEVLEIYIYRWAFAATIPRLGYASAAAVIFGLFVFVIGLFQLLGIRAARRSGMQS